MIEIESNIIFDGKFPEFDTETIRNEPMIFNGSPGFSYEAGGPITRAFLTALNNDWDGTDHPTPIVFDSRVHMLMPAWH